MFLAKLDRGMISRLTNTVRKNNKALEFYDALVAGKASVYFHLDEKDQAVIYESIYDNELTGISVSFDRVVKTPYQYPSPEEEPMRCALALYIHQKDSESSPEQLKATYGFLYPSLSKYSSMTPAQAERFAQDKIDFLELCQELSTAKETKEGTGHPELSIEIKEDRDDTYSIILHIKGQTDHPISNAGSFFKSINSGRVIADGKGSRLNLTISNWTHEDQKIIFGLSAAMRTNSYYEEYPSSGLRQETIVEILTLFAGRKVTYNDTFYEVSTEVDTVYVEVDGEGRIRSSMDVSQSASLFGKRCAAAIDGSSHTIRLWKYASIQTKKIFQFLVSHPGFPFELMQEEIASNFLPVIQNSVPVADEFKKKSENYRSTICFYITYNEDGTLTTETKFKIKGEEVDRETYILQDASNAYNAFALEIEALGLEENMTIDDEDKIGALVATEFTALSKRCNLYLSENLQNVKIHAKAPISIVAKSGIDWFNVEYQSNSLSAEDVYKILQGYKKKHRYVRVGDSFYSLEDKELASMVREFDPEEELTSDSLPLYQALKLKATSSMDVTLGQRLTDLFTSLVSFKEKEVEIPSQFASVLRPYQLDAVKWLLTLSENHLCGILADDMGLGKSLETITFLDALNEEAPILIVSPKSLLYNWKNEFAKWGSSKNVFVVDGGKGNRQSVCETMKGSVNSVYITSYDSLRNDKDLYEGTTFSTLILDEGQYIANALAEKSKAVKRIDALHRFVLTGTPIQNSYMDLWSIFDFLLPGYFPGYREFRMLYGSFEENHDAEIRRLETMIAPFILRRKKDEVLKDLPPKTEEVTTLTMDDRAFTLYQATLEEVKESLRKDNELKGKKIQVLAQLTRLRQICVDPTVVYSNFDGVPVKMQQTISMIEEAILNGHKILVFSSFVEVLSHLRFQLDDAGISSYMIYGQTDAEDRLAMANDFNESDDIKVMLVSLKAGGTGLNLIGADIVIHLDPWWNVAAEDQASDRAHRIGQQRPVTVMKLVCKDTIEEKIIELQKKKRALSDIIHVDGEQATALTDEDIAFLLS